MKQTTFIKLCGLTGIWSILLLVASNGFNLWMLNIEMGTTSFIPHAIFLTVLPIVVAIVLTYALLRVTKEDSDEQKSKKKSGL
ncbi:hypothetical protein BC01_063 [Bacillus phage BC01]|nr:hypothetical protein PBC6_056 [Bacillus phage PBC6]AXU41160.1 hypothetical protein BC01_063 [Bacillus phage BC01]